MPAETFSLVLPCYNEEATIETTVRDAHRWLLESGRSGEIIVVDDGSRDRSAEILERLTKELKHMRVIHHERNQGYGLAIRTGCDAAAMDIIGFMDSDGQFRANDIDLLLAYIGVYAFVTGRRRRRADSTLRNLFGKVLGAMNVIVLGLWVRDVNCGMKVFRKEIWQIIRPTHGVEKLFNTEMFLRLKRADIPWQTVDVPHYPRRAGNPTGAKLYVIARMFRELWELRTAKDS